MAIKRYKGKYYTAEDATTIIDYPTIKEGSKLMREAAKELEALTKRINQLKECCNRDALSVDGKNLNRILNTYENNTNEFYIFINQLSEMIDITAEKLTNRKQVIFNEEAKELEKRHPKPKKKKTSKKKVTK